MLILGSGELQIRPNGWWLVYFIPNKRIGNADTRCGRIANSPERRETGRIPSLQCGWAAVDGYSYKRKGYPTFIVNQAVMQSAT